jgi:hypothetical protein
MQKSVALSCLIMSLAVSATALADGRKDHEGERFSVPFFIENALANAPGALRADFTLKHPAILELPSRGSSPQKRMAGNAVADAVSVERLTSRHCAPSAARVFSASAAKRTASLPIKRCAGRRSLDARQSTT